MLEPAMASHAFGQHFFSRMSERRMAQVVCERNRFRQILVQRQRSCDRATDRRHLDGMGKASSQMIARAVEKDLRLVFEPSEGTRMNDARPVSLKFRSIGVTCRR